MHARALAGALSHRIRAVRRFRFHSAMARLALLAMLLLASLPTAGRWVAATQAETGWTALCTSGGMQWVRAGDHGSPVVAHDGDCAYCPLLHALDSPVVAPAWLPPAAASSAFVVVPASQRSPDAPRSGLGARGPPRHPGAIA